MDKKSITVQIGGLEYSLKTDENPEEVTKVIRFVDEKIRNLTENTSVTSQTKIAVLTALNIASELFLIKQEYREVLEKLEQYEADSAKLGNIIDKQLDRYSEVDK